MRIKLLFECDEEKAKKNIRKHGISFEIAAKVFADPNRIELCDDRDYGEERRRYENGY
ncbi:MAG: BrnT family toxin [Lachnospiraceae bacterium]|nr:BrnT family toxin [Lachnospiraceae bacterium]